MTKYLLNISQRRYGESERNLSLVFDTCDSLSGGAIIFIDEIDAFASSRDGKDINEATKKVLSVLLQKIEGFSSTGKSILICATNRKADLDSALISRFDLSIKFDLPDYKTRYSIFSRYAQQLTEKDTEFLSSESESFSCRDIKDLCKHAERLWASKIVRKEASQSESVPLSIYLFCLHRRRESVNVGIKYEDSTTY